MTNRPLTEGTASANLAMDSRHIRSTRASGHLTNAVGAVQECLLTARKAAVSDSRRGRPGLAGQAREFLTAQAHSLGRFCFGLRDLSGLVRPESNEVYNRDMLIKDNSPLRRLPTTLSPKQAQFCDGVTRGST